MDYLPVNVSRENVDMLVAQVEKDENGVINYMEKVNAFMSG